MKIINILTDCAMLLGLTDDVQVLQNATEDKENEILQENPKIANLLNLLQFSIRELCTNYIPMINRKTIKSLDKKYSIGELENYIRILNIYKDGKAIKFKIVCRNILFQEDGEYVINYSSYPTISSMFDDIDFLQKLSPDVIVFGLCSYFSLANGLFDEFERFHDKYVSKAEALKCLRNFEIPSRRWE